MPSALISPSATRNPKLDWTGLKAARILFKPLLVRILAEPPPGGLVYPPTTNGTCQGAAATPGNAAACGASLNDEKWLPQAVAKALSHFSLPRIRWYFYYSYLNYLGKKAARAMSRDLLDPGRPAPARALTPRPRWKLTRLSPVPPDTAHQPKAEFRTNSRRANASDSQPPIHLSRATGAPPCLPGWCRVCQE